MERTMKRWVWTLIGCVAVSAQAQGRGEPGAAVEKPAFSRTYGTARPPGPAPAVQAPGQSIGRPAPLGAPPQAAPPPVQTPPPVYTGGSGGGRHQGYVPPAPVRVTPPAYTGGGRYQGYAPPAPVHVHRPPRTHVDVVIGAPWPRPWYGPRPVYPGWGWGWGYPYPPPPVIVAAPPPPVIYVERPAIDAGAPAAGYWYWCAAPEGWYPEVVECPEGWQPVAPRAAP